MIPTLLLSIIIQAQPMVGELFISQHIVASEAWRDEFDNRFGIKSNSIIQVRYFRHKTDIIAVYTYENNQTKLFIFDNSRVSPIDFSGSTLLVGDKNLTLNGKKYKMFCSYALGPFQEQISPKALPPSP